MSFGTEWHGYIFWNQQPRMSYSQAIRESNNGICRKCQGSLMIVEATMTEETHVACLGNTEHYKSLFPGWDLIPDNVFKSIVKHPKKGG